MEDERREEVWGAWGEAVGEVEMLMPEEEGRPLLWGLLLVLLLVLRMDSPDLSVEPEKRPTVKSHLLMVVVGGGGGAGLLHIKLA